MNIKVIMILAIIIFTEYRLLFSWYVQYLVGHTKESRKWGVIQAFEESNVFSAVAPINEYFSVIQIEDRKYIVNRGRGDTTGKEIQFVITDIIYTDIESDDKYYIAYRTKYVLPYLDRIQLLWQTTLLFVVPLLLRL